MLGVSTYCLHHLPLGEALEHLSSLTDFVEVMADGPHYFTDTEILENFSLRYSVHTPFRGINIACLFEPIRKASVDVLTGCFEIASGITHNFVIHPGYFGWEEERVLSERQLLISLNELNAAAEEYSVNIYIENMANHNFFFLRTPEDFPLFNGTGFALDTGHANLNGCLPDFLEFPIGHMHLHDNNGLRDSHSPVGEGAIDFGPVMNAVRRNHATSVIEVNTLEGVMTSIRALEHL